MDRDHVAVEAGGARRLDVQIAESLHPEVKRPFRDREADRRDLSASRPPLRPGGPAEEGHRGPGRAEVVAEVNVVRIRHVLVDALLDEAQAEHGDVEVDVLLNIACDAGHVVDARNGGRQAKTSVYGRLRPQTIVFPPSPSPPCGGAAKSGGARWGALRPPLRPAPRSPQPWVRVPLPAGAPRARSPAP